MNKFEEIFSRHDTDKVNPGHYEYGYENEFSRIRNDVKLIFEIGVNRGGSVRAWKEYFPNAVIVGLEIDPSCYFEEERIKIEIGNASTKEFIDSILQKYGNPEIVVDDGSHFSSDIKKSFELLYPHVKLCYVIEDYGTQFQSFRGGFYINDGVPAINIAHKKIDELLCAIPICDCKSINIYNSICFFWIK
jgi:hypothetical protein